MRRLNLVLLATLQLCGARAGSQGAFNIHEDLLAFPKFEVVFDDRIISEKDATALLERNAAHSTYSADFSQSTIRAANQEQQHDSDEASEHQSTTEAAPEHTYEIMKMSPHRYLCSIPVVQSPRAENVTETELAKAAAIQESHRAALSGWSLMSSLENQCIYFRSGWWSYSFCNNREIVQYHALPSITPGKPPLRDPTTAEFVLGRVPTIPESAHQGLQVDRATAAAAASEHEGWDEEAPLPAELVVRGDERYLVQRLEGGTVCDLTQRERTIEVQYHCAPGLQEERIGWIKEITICSYLMVINTPRLCNDVAFRPPEEPKADPINCQLIFDGPASEVPAMRGRSELSHHNPSDAEQRDAQVDADSAWWEDTPVTIGGVAVGSRSILSLGDEVGKPPIKLPVPADGRLGGEALRNNLQKKLERWEQGQGGQGHNQGEAPNQGHQDGDGNGQAADRPSLLGKLSDLFGAVLGGNEEEHIDVIAQGDPKSRGGKVTQLTSAEIEELELKAEVVEDTISQVIGMAGDAGWRLELVSLRDGDTRELRAYLDDDEDDEGSGGRDTKPARKKRKKEVEDGDQTREEKSGQGEGSEEEFYNKDEL